MRKYQHGENLTEWKVSFEGAKKSLYENEKFTYFSIFY